MLQKGHVGDPTFDHIPIRSGLREERRSASDAFTEVRKSGSPIEISRCFAYQMAIACHEFDVFDGLPELMVAHE